MDAPFQKLIDKQMKKEIKERKEKKKIEEQQDITGKEVFELHIFNRQRQKEISDLDNARRSNRKPLPKINPESDFKIKKGLWEVIKNYQEVRSIIQNNKIL